MKLYTVSETIRKGYSDNLFVYSDTAERANQTLLETVKLLESYHFKCHDIFCENKLALKDIPAEKVSKKLQYSMFDEIFVDEKF